MLLSYLIILPRFRGSAKGHLSFFTISEIEGAGYIPGYKVKSQSSAYFFRAGIWGLVGAADLTGDGYAEVITGRDHLYLHAYSPTGQQLPNWPIRTYLYPDKTRWGTDPYVEFTRNAPSMGDLDGNGSVEVVIAGKLRDPLQGGATVNSAVMVMLANGQRSPGWSTPQLGNGAPVADTYSPNQAPALADINGNGQLEIVVTMTDGTARAYRSGGGLSFIARQISRHFFALIFERESTLGYNLRRRI